MENSHQEQDNLREELERAQSGTSRLHAERDRAAADLEKIREELERSQATVSKVQLQQDKLQNAFDKSQTELDKLQEKLDKSTGEIRRVSKLIFAMRATVVSSKTCLCFRILIFNLLRIAHFNVLGTAGKRKARVRFRECPIAVRQGLGTSKPVTERAGILAVRSRSS